jgi:hypothetical protein
MQSQADLDLLRVIHQVRDQSVRTPLNVTTACVENHFPKEQQLASLQLIGEGMLSELRVHDRA